METVKKTCYIHVQQPATYPNFFVLPLLWFNLETYYHQNSEHASEWDWIPPIIDTEIDIDKIIQHLSNYERLDVVGFSRYIWDEVGEVEKLQTWIKTNHPDCIIAIGGPHQDVQHREDFFRRNKLIDVSCDPMGYGEVFWTALLDQISIGKIDYDSIPFAIYPKYGFIQRAKAQVNRREITWCDDAYGRHSAFIDAARDFVSQRNYKLAVSVEFSRGCPYSCTFCEWGGTSTKVVFKPMELIEKDLSFLIERKIDHFNVMDANLGIVARDVEVIDLFIELCKKNNHVPHITVLGYAKNEKRYVNQILEKCADFGLIDELNVSIQSLNLETLSAVKRVDAPWKKQIHDMLPIRDKHPSFDIRLQNIVALPESTLADSYEWFDVIHEYNATFCLFMWHLLPSTPAYAPDYMEKYQIKYVEAKALKLAVDYPVKPDELKNHAVISTPIVVSTATLSFDDFIETFVVTALISAGKRTSAFYKTIEGVHAKTGLPYSKLYKSFVDEVAKNPNTGIGRWYANFADQLTLACKGGDAFIDIYKLPYEDGCYCDCESYWMEMFKNVQLWLPDFYKWVESQIKK